MNNVITVKELLKLCRHEVMNGNADKKILISADDEGNSYHELFFPFTTDLEDFADTIYCVNEEDLKDYIILG